MTLREVQDAASEETATVMQYKIAIPAEQEVGMDISNVMLQELIKLFIDQTMGLTAEDTAEMDTGEMQGE